MTKTMWFARILGLSAALAMVSGGSAFAQGAPEPPKPAAPPIFAQVVPQPTHKNGYEELVRAGDLVGENKDIDDAFTGTLTQKRRVLAQPAVIQALALVRVGLQKPIVTPRIEIDENTLFPELPLFRKLGRLLSIEQYVAFSEGRVSSAIESLRVGLQMGYRIQTDSLISGLVGVAIDAIVLKEFSNHFEQLSTIQSDQVLRLARDFLALESPIPHLILREQDFALGFLDRHRTNVTEFIQQISGLMPDKDDENSDFSALELRLREHPEELGTVIDSVKKQVRAQTEMLIANAKLPPPQRKNIPPLKPHSLAGQVFAAVATVPGQILDRYLTETAKFRQLGLHMLIRRYRWEHNALPDSLTVLNPRDLGIDPFTGGPVNYVKTDRTYTLASKGYTVQNDDGTPKDVPVKLIP